MLRLTFSGIRARKTRFFLSALAVALGVAFMAGTLILTDTMGQAADGIAVRAAEGTDALVRSSRVAEDPATGEAVRSTVDEATVAAVRSLPTVAAAEPRVEGVAQLVGPDGRLIDDNANRATPVALAWQQDTDLNPMQIVAGREPANVDEVVIDRASAHDAGLVPGDTVGVTSPAGTADFIVAGVATYGGANDAAGAHVVALNPTAAAEMLGTPGRFDAVQVKAIPGVSETQLVAEVAAAFDDDAEIDVLTGTEMTSEAKAEARAGVGFMTTFLVAFAIVALLVGSFVIANSFSITMAQRTREHALSRAIGATRRQLLGAVVLESAVTGVVASILGVVLGVATALGLRALLAGFGLDLPAGPPVIALRTVIVSVVLGTTVTVAAALLPARRASRIPPVAAMRDVSADRSGQSIRRGITGLVVVATGAVLIATGLKGSAVEAVGLGAVLVFGGVATLGPVIARPATRILGAPLARWGMSGVLARENASRNPRRTAATASALMIGVGLVVFMTIVAASAKTSISSSVDTAAKGDWIVTTAFGQGGVSPGLAEDIDRLPETAAVTGLRYTPATIDHGAHSISAFDPAVIDELIDLDVQSGDVADLNIGGLAVQAAAADAAGWTVGDSVTVEFPETGARELDVVAIYGTMEPVGSYAVSTATFEANVADATDEFVFVGNASGTDGKAARPALEGVVAEYPTTELLTNDEFKASIGAEIDQILTLVYALLFLAVVIALFGIANTLALSMHERTRELGLLRAVGMARGQVRSAVRWESVVIALLGTGLGLVVGLGFGWALVQALADQDLDHLSVPLGQLTIIAMAGAAAGVLAAVVPSRRASRLDVLAALRCE